MTMKLAILVVPTLALFGQARFEVASVKLSGPDERLQRQVTVAGDRFVAIMIPLKWLIVESFGIQDVQLTGPAWMGQVMVDIRAKGKGVMTRDSREFREMLQGLLQERFGLQTHTEQKPTAVYVMSVVDEKLLNKAKTTPTDPIPPFPSDYETNLASLLNKVTLGQSGLPLSQLLRARVEVPDNLRSMGPYNLFVGEEDPVGYLKQRHGILLTKKTMLGDQIIVDQVSKVPTKD